MGVSLYARVSSDSQDVDLSISAQLRALREYAGKHGYQVVKEYVDEAASGRTASRPAFREMIALARTKQPPFDAILVWKLNRFARNRADSVTYKTLLRKKGIEVISITEPVDDSPTGRLLEGMIESVDEFYSANLGQDIKRGMRENALRGFFNGSRPPYGMRKVAVRDGNKTRHKLEPDLANPGAVHLVERMFDMADSDIGCKEIAKTLNSEGLRTGDGERWGRTTVHKILTNEAYCGTLVWGGRPGHPAIRSGEPPVRIENAWPAIIKQEVFDSLQQKLKAKRPKVTHPRRVLSLYLLSGLLFCSCGRAMIGHSAKSHRHHYYVCSRNHKQGKDACNARALPREKLERQVLDQIRERVLSEENLNELVRLVNEEMQSSASVLKDRLEIIDTELGDVRSRLSRLYDALETGKLSLDDLSPRIRELRSRQDDLNKSRVQAEAAMVAEQVLPVDMEEVRNCIRDLRNLLVEAELVERKAFLRSFVHHIEVDKEQVKIVYHPPWQKNIIKDNQESGVLSIETPKWR